MNHQITLYNNPTSTRRTTDKLKKLPAEASAKFQATQKKIEAFRDVNAQYEVNSIATLGKYAKSALISIEKYKEINSENEEDDDEQEEDDNEQEEDDDEQEEDADEQVMNNEQESEEHLLNKLRAMAKKRILNGTILLSESLNIRKTKGLSSVLINKAVELLRQSRMDSEDMELMKLIKFINQNVSEAEANSVINAHPWLSLMAKSSKAALGHSYRYQFLFSHSSVFPIPFISICLGFE